MAESTQIYYFTYFLSCLIISIEWFLLPFSDVFFWWKWLCSGVGTTSINKSFSEIIKSRGRHSEGTYVDPPERLYWYRSISRCASPKMTNAKQGSNYPLDWFWIFYSRIRRSSNWAIRGGAHYIEISWRELFLACFMQHWCLAPLDTANTCSSVVGNRRIVTYGSVWRLSIY